ncbi:cobyrinic acid a,c-diamide synthase [Kaistia algarum]|uniref:cobyrinate a,c-diamide synthase n=1 Tax=Kaistia algarum TaxID=2083279 RepID=UPI000CE8DEF9|nr:cobyrinate a,c-diamide synthase [Kaistia algarum]MCX5513087.1 cobyrinate a,c-diamide synthase [Kaistia algarum]PPE81438.1 cobyrinic acid a,c-diamide synthase [Kaistia algarum]
MSARGVVLSAVRSSSGKTVVATGILAALARRGMRVRGAKSGPDYIDPAFHAAASGAPSFNLDSWAMAPPLLDGLLQLSSQDADLLLIEGALGLFDGVSGPPGRRGSTADLAARFRLPVILVHDVSGQSQTVAAILRGMMLHDPDVRVAGVILNRVGSERHRRLVEEAVGAIGLPVLGALPRQADLQLPERHLGLVQAGEDAAIGATIARIADSIERHCDLDAIAALALPPALADASPAAPALPPPGQRIALASDAAFSFLYPHVIAGWRAAGARLVPFSPLADEAPPSNCDACWLPGGYPELHAARIASAETFLGGLRRFAEARPVHGECGGHMVLGRALVDADGVRHTMAGLLDHVTSFAERRLHLGYRVATLSGDGILGQAGTILRGHEFHYSVLVERGGDAPFAFLQDARGEALGPEGGRRGLVSGSYFHAIANA